MTIYGRAREFIDAGINDKALGLLVEHLSSNPQDSDAWALGAQAFAALGLYVEAHASIAQALALYPDHLEALLARGQTQQLEGDEAEAEQTYRYAERQHPRSARPACRLGWLLLRRARHDEARQALGRALAVAPGLVSALSGLAMILEHAGESHRAVKILTPHVVVDRPHPLLTFAWGRAMVTTGRGRDALPTLRAALLLADQRTDRVNLLHLIGDCLNATSNTAGAFRSYTQANALRTRTFDGPKHLDAVRLMTRHVPRPGLARPSPRTGRALLVVGIPRSGTSLVETMLCRHPDLAPAGELEAWRHLAQHAADHSGSDPWYRYPERLSTSLLDDLAKSYGDTLDGVDGTARRVVDKMPNNQLHLGLAAWAIPDLVVVHCVRDPADTAWSCFRLPLQDGLAFTTCWSGLAHWIRAERELMAHWTATLDVPIIQVRYEDLVRNPECQLRPVLDAAGLPWTEDVARHSGTLRTVATASYAQVRKPLYTSSIGRSKPYHHLMTEFFDTWASFGPPAASRAA
ncbi:MAG: Flp pilus assembly protein TadD [Kiritimatiellia bacterium]|jgi:Flp pilus assembly protein TadD